MVCYQSIGNAKDMRSRPLLLLLATLSFCVAAENITSFIGERRIELLPVVIECSLTDLIVIHVPVIANSKYYLTRPDGEEVKLDSPYGPKNEKREHVNTTNSGRGDVINIRNQSMTFKVLNVNGKKYDDSAWEDLEEYVVKRKPEDVIIGPLTEDDHGNWVLSIYCTDSEGHVELFQVLSVVIVEKVKARASKVELSKGSDFKPRLYNRIKNLLSCEIISPGSKDRFYYRKGMLDYCGYVIPDITREDEGVWTIVGVGPIVYKSTVDLVVHNRSLYDQAFRKFMKMFSKYIQYIKG